MTGGLAAPGLAQVLHDVEQAHKADAETLLSLTAEGKALYERDTIKLDGYGYCGQALGMAERGDLRASIRTASKMLHLAGDGGHENMRALAMRDLAIAYSYAGAMDKAHEFAERAMSIAGADPVQVLAPMHKVLGDVALREKNYAEAISAYQRSLLTASERYSPMVRISLANAYSSSGQSEAALKQLGLITNASILQEPHFLRSRAAAWRAGGNLDAARIDYEAVAKSHDDYQRLWAYEGLAQLSSAAQRPAQALQQYRQAVDLANGLRGKFQSEEFKAGLFGDVQRIFDQALHLAVAQNDFVAAWELSEASRTRQLLDTVRSRVKDSLTEQVSLQQVQASLQADDAVVQYHVVGEQVVAWVIGKDSFEARILNVPAQQMQQRVDALRQSASKRRKNILELSEALYADLLAPLPLMGKQRLFIVPHGPLHYLPFQALADKGRYLISQHALVIWPSASVGVQLIQRNVRQERSLLAFGNPATDQNVPPLPGAEHEVQQLAGIIRDSTLYTQKQATKEQFKRSAGSTSLLHVAAHSTVDEIDPMYSKILLTSNDQDSGLLEAHEIYGLQLGRVSLVTLSACETGLGKIRRGEEIMGFTRSFLSAGAESIIASLWPVADQSTVELMTTLYTQLDQGKDLASAMQAAQLELQKNPRFAHPFFWAPFYAMGNGYLRLK